MADFCPKIHICETFDPYTNLATDEYVLNNPHGVFLIFYVNSPSVIIGKNQNALAECDTEKMREQDVKLVRRMSGGGAVYHDTDNLNFSFIMPHEVYNVERQLGVILCALQKLGIDAQNSGRNDITVEGKKISGNAFCVKPNAKLHHGTLLIDTDLEKLTSYLNVDDKKLKSKGITSVRSRVTNISEFAPEITLDGVREAIKAEFEAEYGQTEILVFSETEKVQIAKLAKKNRAWEHLFGQSPAYNYEINDRFSCGLVQLLLEVKNGMISGVTLYTDSLDENLPKKVSDLLLDRKFSVEQVYAVMKKLPQ